MKLSRDKQNRPWMVGLAASSLISLLIGLGIGVDASHGGLSSGNTAAPGAQAGNDSARTA